MTGGYINKMNEQNYIHIQNYPVQCRLYCNKQQAAEIEDRFLAIRLYYNDVLYEMTENFAYTKVDKNGNHYPDFKALQHKELKNEILVKRDIYQKLPSGAIVGNSGLIVDMKKAFNKCLINETGKKEAKGSISIETIRKNRAHNKNRKVINPATGEKEEKWTVPGYYSNKRQRTSYTYQETLSKFSFDEENPKILWANLAGIGKVKIRGFNRKLLFGTRETEDPVPFEDFIKLEPQRAITVTVIKDKCDDYFIVLKFVDVFKSYEKKERILTGGFDIGEINPVITSDGKKYNPLHCPEDGRRTKGFDHKSVIYQRKLDRRQGFANRDFRDKYNKKKEEEGIRIKPSKRYERTQLNNARISRKKTRIRTDYYNKISHEIATSYDVVAMENLVVSDMIEKKKKGKKNGKAEG